MGTFFFHFHNENLSLHNSKERAHNSSLQRVSKCIESANGLHMYTHELLLGDKETIFFLMRER